MKNEADIFLNASTHEHLAQALGYTAKSLRYLAYANQPEDYYITFELAQPNKIRQISAPDFTLKTLQQRIAKILAEIYKPHKSTHGFVQGRNVVSNAKGHVRAPFILKLDIKDFFPSIHFGRIKGLFEAPPFNFPRICSITLARLCCYNGALSQGSPTSPILSNMICSMLDRQLTSFARNNRLYYSRYADDITFSSKQPFTTRVIKSSSPVCISDELLKIFDSNKFEINQNKIILLAPYDSKSVTGVKVNSKLNVTRKYYRAIRAMFHAYEKLGEEAALTMHLAKYSRRRTSKPATSFLRIIGGKIAFLQAVRGIKDPLVIKLKAKLLILKKRSNNKFKMQNKHKNLLSEAQSQAVLTSDIVVFTEGKTDIIHLELALSKLRKMGEFKNLNIVFNEWLYETTGDSALTNRLEWIKKYSKTLTDKINWINKHNAVIDNDEIKTLYLLDRDVSSVQKFCVIINGEEYPKLIFRNTWTCILPVPEFRSDKEKSSISIEHYIPNGILFSENEDGRRLYSKNEFEDGTLIENSTITLEKSMKGKKPYSIIDCDVVQGDKSLACSKNDFALRFYNKELDYPDESLNAFRQLFKKIAYCCDKQIKYGNY